ncbi:16S rRNA (cytidine(1402)-2'-O)-methyltransferase [Permianibacter sp. IMCC34836]|uniref:16S rRNA (cytidine(1402)-2'-O)-methyltransferase n=1 Tax=Permianibacter fluminis TaxID=2738515 RepID=UPI001551C9AC|nr:16S rRNA (cytidine(1402)-2'-O)-methyltransferase [Permianibacter fluminis]NQD39054.1 16S rRNA (cytidine(1402)-2'-O)-methyltransferase [Permianibacter fluminis]
MPSGAGVLYVVATPIGNLADWSARAVSVLRAAHTVYAEDTRHSQTLLNHHDIRTPLRSLHEHNEQQRVSELVELLQQGHDLALISDAGTPLISDPGFKLVRALRAQGCRVSPLPGPCALIAALSCAGLPTDRFSFEGFLPAKAGARRERLQALVADPRTLVFYEAPHRILETLQDCADILGAERDAVLARELTKTFETFLDGTLTELAARVAADDNQQRGEIVLMISGATVSDESADAGEAERVLQLLLPELALSRAVAIAEQLTGLPHKLLYKKALAMKNALPD